MTDFFVAKMENEGTNLEVFSLALQNGSLKEKDLLSRQTSIAAQRKEESFHVCQGLCYNLRGLCISACIEIQRLLCSSLVT